MHHSVKDKNLRLYKERINFQSYLPNTDSNGLFAVSACARLTEIEDTNYFLSFKNVY